MTPVLIIDVTGGVIQAMHATEEFPGNVQIAVVDFDTEDADPSDRSYDSRLDAFVHIWNGMDMGSAENLESFFDIRRLICECQREFGTGCDQDSIPSPGAVHSGIEKQDSLQVYAVFYREPRSEEESRVLMICSSMEIAIRKSREYARILKQNGYLGHEWIEDADSEGLIYRFWEGDDDFLIIEPWTLDQGMA